MHVQEHTDNSRTAFAVRKLISVILSILFLWGSGVTLLIAILNVGIGFADTEADFRSAFLSMTQADEIGYLQDYITLSERIRLYGASEGLDANLQTFRTHYDPENTNFRFSVTDLDGQLLLTNDPLLGTEQALLASDVSLHAVELENRSYLVQKVFEDPLHSYKDIVYGDNSVWLKDRSEFELWYFTNDLVDNAYHSGVTVSGGSSVRHELLFFSDMDEAAAFDYTEAFGADCEWSVLEQAAPQMHGDDSDTQAGARYDDEKIHENDAAYHNGTIQENDDAQDEEGYDENAARVMPAPRSALPKHYAGSLYGGADGYPAAGAPMPDGDDIMVLVTYPVETDGDYVMELEDYYTEKSYGTALTAADPAVEQALNSPLEITIRGVHLDTESCYLRTYLPEELPVEDTIRSNYRIFEFLFKKSEWVVVAMFACAALAVVACIWMCAAAGHTDSKSPVQASHIHKLPFGFFWILPPAAIFCSALLLSLLYSISTPYSTLATFCTGLMLFVAATVVLLLYTTAVRVKTDTFWTSFLFVRILSGAFGMLRHKPAAIAAVTVYLGLLLACNLLLADMGPLLLLALGADLLTLCGIYYCIYAYFELHQHVRRMETGDFSPAVHQIPLAADFERFDASLNDITSSVEEMVARQTKAEHLRTELITNVSHDLKTPLTSICNYVDLLSREPMQTDAASEYLEVLRRQSARLKKLTVDLVDASKASTGNLTVELVPTDLQVLLGQLAGEYEETLANNSLSLVMHTPEQPLMILADGRQIWRVFDNLLNNACKYALPGTRVYLDLRTDGNYAEISLKNVSAVPLNVSPDELMERFVRGDASRHTEGSGLGLSIARDLTALQNGVLELRTDGDLFKAMLIFPLYFPPESGIAEKARIPE